MVAPVALPGPGRSHGLTPGLNISIKFGMDNHQYGPEKVVVRRVIVQVDILLFTVVQLRERGRGVSDVSKWVRMKARTSGIPGINNVAMNVPRTLLCVPLFRLFHLKTSKLLVPYI